MVSRVTGRLAVLLAALWLAVPVPHGLVAAPDPISRAEAWFDDISTMKADFIQVASDGTTATGELHLRRPHRMKIIYDLDEPLILLTTPVWLHVDRPREKTVTSYPINETPLSLILREDVELRSSDFTTRHLVRDGITRITLTRETGRAAGELILEFTDKPFELRRWTVRDAADVTTTVTLQNMRFGHRYENKFFAKSDYPLPN
ncbi:MAG: outer membrane lipoprotein carrier protein LolA [Pseudomonadota bacterium]|jgi:outer membrane lipoprotein-sorting protein|nr:outer membrane lipoprotein carrier protein LolA [Pseudomonadota bacterium]MEC8775640.1 outer membrane lipoprotein carrier protein LolA [Pseudomonadota bacterium]